MKYLDQLNARLAVKKQAAVEPLPLSYVPVFSDLVQKGGAGSGRHKSTAQQRDDDDFERMHPLDYYDQGGFREAPPKTSGTHHTKEVSTGKIMVHGTKDLMDSHVKTLNTAYGAGNYSVGTN